MSEGLALTLFILGIIGVLFAIKAIFGPTAGAFACFLLIGLIFLH